MLTFKEFMALDEITGTNVMRQSGGNYGTGVMNPYWSHGGRYSRTMTADLSRPDQMLYHVARLLDDLERMIHYRQNIPANAPLPMKTLSTEFSQQSIDILVRLSILRPCTEQDLIRSGQQVDPNDPTTRQGYSVDVNKLQELQRQMLAAQKDDQVRNWLWAHIEPMIDTIAQQAFTPRLQIHPSMAPIR